MLSKLLRSRELNFAIMGLGKTAIKLRGAEVGIEAIMLGVVTSIGGK